MLDFIHDPHPLFEFVTQVGVDSVRSLVQTDSSTFESHRGSCTNARNEAGDLGYDRGCSCCNLETKFRNFFTSGLDPLPGLFEALLDLLPSGLETLLDFLSCSLESFFDFLSNLLEALLDLLSSLLEAFFDLFTSFLKARLDFVAK